MDWSAVRHQFPVSTRWAFFDHAAVSPIPAAAVRALAEYADRIAHNGLADIWHWVDRCAYVRSLAARLINAPTRTTSRSSRTPQPASAGSPRDSRGSPATTSSSRPRSTRRTSTRG